MAPAFVGKRLPCVKLMEEQLSSSFASAPQGFLRKTAQFVPYSFKELADLDLLEFSALTAFKLIKYVTGIQRLCVPEDLFWYSFWNTDADGDWLLIKGCNGQTCVVGWHEIAVAFGASHSETEEFRAIKVNNKNFSQYRAGDFLIETIETNAQRKLAPVFVKILYAFRETVFAGTPLATADSWVPWVHLSKEGDIDIRGLHAKFPTPIEDLKVIRDSCKLSDNIPIAEPVNGDARDVPTSTPTKDVDDEPVPQPKSHSSGSPDRQVARQDVRTRDADRETLKAEVKSLRGQLEASKVTTGAKQAKLEQENSDLQERLQREKRASERFKEALQADMKKHANLEERELVIFTLDRAEKALAASRSELAIVKTDLRMLQISGK
ncbi:hypothetical protein R1sor_009529 [Riccia sorocarpa]|uniref:Uncharacterized protein n=1 Tax=Riccia sorocarpa TaxID=122646 RepID=A0ABD3HVM0_9MARC